MNCRILAPAVDRQPGHRREPRRAPSTRERAQSQERATGNISRKIKHSPAVNRQPGHRRGPRRALCT
eukprot:21665-Pyramimonas_sp.AAC.1